MSGRRLIRSVHTVQRPIWTLHVQVLYNSWTCPAPHGRFLKKLRILRQNTQTRVMGPIVGRPQVRLHQTSQPLLLRSEFDRVKWGLGKHAVALHWQTE